MAGRHCVKEGYELNMEAHKCNQPYAWLPAAPPNQLIGQHVSQVTRVFFFFKSGSLFVRSEKQLSGWLRLCQLSSTDLNVYSHVLNYKHL